MHAITYYVQTPTINQLCNLFGDRWEDMLLHDRAQIMAVLSVAVSQISDLGESDRLDYIATKQGFAFYNSGLMGFLAELDEELSGIQDALQLIAGLAHSTPLDQLETI